MTGSGCDGDGRDGRDDDGRGGDGGLRGDSDGCGGLCLRVIGWVGGRRGKGDGGESVGRLLGVVGRRRLMMVGKKRNGEVDVRRKVLRVLLPFCSVCSCDGVLESEDLCPSHRILSL